MGMSDSAEPNLFPPFVPSEVEGRPSVKLSLDLARDERKLLKTLTKLPFCDEPSICCSRKPLKIKNKKANWGGEVA
jgi:hypothetical protein